MREPLNKAADIRCGGGFARRVLIFLTLLALWTLMVVGPIGLLPTTLVGLRQLSVSHRYVNIM